MFFLDGKNLWKHRFYRHYGTFIYELGLFINQREYFMEKQIFSYNLGADPYNIWTPQLGEARQGLATCKCNKMTLEDGCT